MKHFLCLVATVVTTASAFAQLPAGDGSKIEALVPGEYTEMLPSHWKMQAWWVLFQAPGEQVRLRYAPLEFKARMLPDTSVVHDIHAEGFEDNEVILLFRGTKELPRGPVSTVFSGALPLVPGLSVSLGPEGAGQRTLEAVASKEPIVAGANKGDPPQNFLHISLRTADGKSQLLYTAFLGNDGTVPILRWAGDLDKDHQLDLFIENPRSIHATRISLFLSSYAEEGELVHDPTGRVNK